MLLSPIKAAHARELFPVLADRQLYRFIEDESPTSEQVLRAKFRKLESRLSPDKSQLWLNWLVKILANDTAIGYVQATVSRRSADMAWVIGRNWQNRGYASEAATGLVRWLRSHEVPVIRALVTPGHTASQKVARNAGLINTHAIEANEDVWVFHST